MTYMGILNKREDGMDLYRITFTPKGKIFQAEALIWAKNRLDASNYLINNKIYGNQHSIEIDSTNLMYAKERK